MALKEPNYFLAKKNLKVFPETAGNRLKKTLFFMENIANLPVKNGF